MATTDVVMHNAGQPDAFGYQIAFVKASGEVYSATSYVTEINVWESMFAKAMCCKLGVFDGGGLMEQIALQPGDKIELTLMKEEDATNKLIKTFIISDVGSGQRNGNSQAKTYSISAMSQHAFNNMSKNVFRGFKGPRDGMLKKICEDYLGLTDVEIEATTGDSVMVSPGKSPFKVIGQIMLHSLSSKWGKDDSLFFFYEDRDKVRFKTLKSVVQDAEVHKYTVSIDKNVDGVADLSKIQHFVQLKAGSQTERINGGMYENEIVEYDHLSRTFSSNKFSYEKTGDQLRLLGQGDIVDKANNIKGFINEAESTIRGLSNMVRYRAADEAYDQTNTLRDKYGTMVAQKALFNQLIYAVQIFGNPGIKAGDVIDVTSPAMAMQSDAPELDFSFQGRFLVGDVRHRIIDGEKFVTILNLFKDGFETPYVREETK